MNIWEIFLIAIGLSMDTFSLSLAISLTNKFNNINKLSILVGLYHFIMPIIGCVIGNRLYFLIHFNYSHLLGVILILIAINMLRNKKGSTIFLCTDGLANKGIGGLEFNNQKEVLVKQTTEVKETHVEEKKEEVVEPPAEVEVHEKEEITTPPETKIRKSTRTHVTNFYA